jgi:hypothetical protein
MNSAQLRSLLTSIQESMPCPKCGANYEAEHIHFLGQVDLTCLVQLECTECSLPIIINCVISSDINKISPRIVSDLNAKDVIRFRKLAPLQTDDLLRMHQDLQTAGGDFTSLFGKKTH